MRHVRSKLLVLLQFILCVYSIRPYGNLLPIRAEGGEPAKGKKSAKIPENQAQKTEDETLQTEILKKRFPRYDDVSIYYHFH